MPRLTKSDSALRTILFGNAPLRTKLEALAGMEYPSETFLLQLVSSETHPKLKTKAADRLAQLRHRREVDRILAEETARLANRESVRETDKPDTPAVAHSLTEVLAEPTKIEAPIRSDKPLRAAENLIRRGTEKRRQVSPEPMSVSSFEGESERRRYQALFARERGLLNSTKDPMLRASCNPSDLDAIDRAYFQARAKIESGENFSNEDCGEERNVLRIWISAPGKGVDGLGRKTAEGKIADALWDELEALALTVKNLSIIGD